MRWQLKTQLAAFRDDQRGGTVLVFALFTVTLMAVVGATIDYGRATRLKMSMQDALDTGVLAVGSGRQAGGSDGQARLEAFLTANWRQRYDVGTLSSTYQELADDVVKATASAPMPTTFMKVVGLNSLDIKAESQGQFGIGKAEVALVLDTTGSMEGNKLHDLKKAAKDLVEKTYEKHGAEDKIKFSIVPFAQYVNVGTQSRGEGWLDVEPDGPVNVCRLEKPVTNKWGCTTRTGTWYDDGKPVSYDYEECAGYEYGPEQNVCTVEQRTWYGCVGSRQTPLDRQVDISSGQRIKGIMNQQCGSPLKRLTKAKSELKSAIEDFNASGETYMAPGLMWGWRTVSPTSPFNDAAPKSGSDRARKVIVLMTDGTNTASASSPTHQGWNPGDADQTTLAVCQNIKADGIEIYAIAFDVTDPTALNVLKSCATSVVTHYFSAQSTTALNSAFQRIGDSLTKVRLKQ